MTKPHDDPLTLVGDRLLTSTQAAMFLGVSEGTLRNRRMAEGAGPPFVRVGRNVRYSRNALVAWVEKSQCA